MDHEELENGAGSPANGNGASPEMDAVPDLIDTLRATRAATGEAGDVTLAGYAHEHERPPAFEGNDGYPYTVDVAVEETEDATRPFVAYLLFLRWAATGAGIMGHVESGDVASGRTEEEARAAAGNLTLWELKAELDAALDRRSADQ